SPLPLAVGHPPDARLVRPVPGGGGGHMKSLVLALAGLALLTPPALRAQAPSPEARVRQTVQAFYAAFNSHDFDHVADITTDDWNHINPLGGRTRGRAQVLAELKEVHGSFLK